MKQIKYLVTVIVFSGLSTCTFAQVEHKGEQMQQNNKTVQTKADQDTTAQKAQPKKKAEHPPHHHPTKKGAQVSINNFKKAVENYVSTESASNNGYFLVHDEKQDKYLKLKFTKMMDEDLSALGNNQYFVCSDFEGADGNTYDVDIIMQGTSAENLKAVKKYVHKVNGNPRYEWVEENGTWKQQATPQKESKKKIKK